MTEKPADNATRTAAIWATAIAVPVALLVAVGIFSQISPAGEEQTAAAASSAPAAVPGTPVEMAAPTLDERTAQVCLAVTSQLPTEVRGLAARKVSAGPEQNAAFGEPAIEVACGGTQPKTCATAGQTGCVPMDTELMLMNQVCWYPDLRGDATVFTTMDREVPVAVTVPKSYESAAQWANEFSDVVVETDKSLAQSKIPYGCTG